MCDYNTLPFWFISSLECSGGGQCIRGQQNSFVISTCACAPGFSSSNTSPWFGLDSAISDCHIHTLTHTILCWLALIVSIGCTLFAAMRVLVATPRGRLFWHACFAAVCLGYTFPNWTWWQSAVSAFTRFVEMENDELVCRLKELQAQQNGEAKIQFNTNGAPGHTSPPSSDCVVEHDTNDVHESLPSNDDDDDDDATRVTHTLPPSHSVGQQHPLPHLAPLSFSRESSPTHTPPKRPPRTTSATVAYTQQMAARGRPVLVMLATFTMSLYFIGVVFFRPHLSNVAVSPYRIGWFFWICLLIAIITISHLASGLSIRLIQIVVQPMFRLFLRLSQTEAGSKQKHASDRFFRAGQHAVVAVFGFTSAAIIVALVMLVYSQASSTYVLSNNISATQSATDQFTWIRIFSVCIVFACMIDATYLLVAPTWVIHQIIYHQQTTAKNMGAPSVHRRSSIGQLEAGELTMNTNVAATTAPTQTSPSSSPDGLPDALQKLRRFRLLASFLVFSLGGAILLFVLPAVIDYVFPVIATTGNILICLGAAVDHGIASSVAATARHVIRYPALLGTFNTKFYRRSHSYTSHQTGSSPSSSSPTRYV